MPTYKVAHIKHDGADIILVCLDRSFEYKSAEQKDAVVQSLQACATTAGLKGVVVPVWDTGDGSVKSLASPNWSAFARSLTWEFIRANINRDLTCL